MSNALDYVRNNCGIAGEEVAEMVDVQQDELDLLRTQVRELRGQRDEMMEVLNQIGNTACGEASHQYMALTALAKVGGTK